MAFRLIVACALLATVYGASVPRIGQRISGGEEVEIDAYPWQCSVQADDSHIGSATIITRRHALTAASLVAAGELQDALLVRCGATNHNRGGTVKALTRIVVHSEYNSPVPFNNDIALLVFKFTIQFGPTIQPVRVAGPQFVLAANSSLLLSGWATPEEGQDEAEVPTALQAIELTSVERAICVAAHGNVEEGEGAGQPRVTESQICAIDSEINGNSACNGDSGNPLIFVQNSTAVLVGLTSWTTACGENTPPTVFTNVASHIPWIRANL